MSEIEFENDYIDEMGKNVLNPCNLTKSIRNNQQDQITNIKKGNIWQEIVDEYNKDRQELNDYLTKRDSLNGQVTIAQLPLIKDLNESLFPFLCEALIAMLEKVSDEHSYFRQKSTFQGLDFISEYMYNSNPKHPERKAQWTYIFDMEWAEEHLRKLNKNLNSSML
ncbi:hypothetical protein ABEB36_011837 [Hypothenemus hampei]|uniref:Uncharacterized protein n=1 Tax=Hypothenemus hampei TaxID=57062 RepID=A0ABD1E9B1_HYPHA